MDYFNNEDLGGILQAHTHNTRAKSATVRHVGKIRAIFVDHADELIKLLHRWPVFVGCVAWLTHERILEAMRGRCMGLVLQKESNLLPDVGDVTWTNWRRKMRCAYRMLYGGNPTTPSEFARMHSSNVLQAAFGEGHRIEQPVVVCAGLAHSSRGIRPYMHDKFIVFGTKDTYLVEDGDTFRESERFTPRAVWTGSFNLSANASRSLENALYIENDDLARVFYEEWGAVMSIGEPLDWKAPHVRPQQRFGEA